MRIRNIFRADRVVGPYYAFKDNVENFELSQASWEKTGKTEGEFWSVQGGPEGNRNPSGLIFFCQRFLLEKQKKMLTGSRKFLI